VSEIRPVCKVFLTEEGHAQCEWKLLLPRTRLSVDKQHFFSIAENSLNQVPLFFFLYYIISSYLNLFSFFFSNLQVGVVSHLKITVYPDGGIMRVRAIDLRVVGQQTVTVEMYSSRSLVICNFTLLYFLRRSF
jgi:allantoicase